MKREKINIMLRGYGKLPFYATKQAAGADIYAANVHDIILEPMDRIIVPTGIYIGLQDGYEAQMRPRSGLAIKHGITLLNTPGTIDADFRGEVGVILINLSKETFVVKRGERIAQMVIYSDNGLVQGEWNVVDELDSTERGEGGFGHTGFK